MSGRYQDEWRTAFIQICRIHSDVNVSSVPFEIFIIGNRAFFYVLESQYPQIVLSILYNTDYFILCGDGNI